jgi:hypothetical protein
MSRFFSPPRIFTSELGGEKGEWYFRGRKNAEDLDKKEERKRDK